MRKVARAGLQNAEALSVTYEGGEAVFTFSATDEAAARIVRVAADDTQLRFFPERSAGHRDVLKALGLA